MVRFLKWVAVTINSILLTAGIIIAVFGVILWKTDLSTFDEEVKKYVPSELTKVTDEAPQVPELFIWLGKLVMAFGLVIVSLCIIGIFALTCCQKCKCCLVFYLILLIVLAVAQAAVVAVMYSGNGVEDQVDKALKPVFLDEDKRDQNYEFILSTQVFLKCCAIKGFRDYYCAGVYDPYCNFGCMQSLTFDGKKAIPVCPVASREARGVENTVEASCKKDAKKPFTYANEPKYTDVPGFAKLKLIGKGVTKPSEMPGCSEKIFDDIRPNLKYVQITCIVVLCIEVFCILVTIVLICQGKKEGGGQNNKPSFSSSSPSSSRR